MNFEERKFLIKLRDKLLTLYPLTFKQEIEELNEILLDKDEEYDYITEHL